MTIKPVADLYLIAYEDGVPYKSTRDAREANEAIGEGFKVEEFVSLENHRAAMIQAGNSPVIPDGWIPVSERMPDDDYFVYIWPRPEFGIELHVGKYCECHPKGDGWYAQVYEQNYGIEWHPIIVTHWMPLPAAPQQEVK
ncbi:DUF551 domain-containing protein [Citrobacter braakii]